MKGPSEPPKDWYGQGLHRFEVDDGETLKLTTIACKVYLTTQQAEEPDLASALQMLGHAAVVVGRLEDAIVFNGQPGPDAPPLRPARPGSPPSAPGPPVVAPQVYSVHGGQQNPGLDNPIGRAAGRAGGPLRITGPTWAEYGENLVGTIVQAINMLEGSGKYGPFACVLGDSLYRAANTPSRASLVLPSDRFVPFLGGPLLRSSTLESNHGVVVALSGSSIDLVVASDVHVSSIQRSLEPRYVLQVAERFVLRMKQPEAVCRLEGPSKDPVSLENSEELPESSEGGGAPKK